MGSTVKEKEKKNSPNTQNSYNKAQKYSKTDSQKKALYMSINRK